VRGDVVLGLFELLGDPQLKGGAAFSATLPASTSALVAGDSGVVFDPSDVR
jgi:hypothetical protein